MLWKTSLNCGTKLKNTPKGFETLLSFRGKRRLSEYTYKIVWPVKLHVVSCTELRSLCGKQNTVIFSVQKDN